MKHKKSLAMMDALVYGGLMIITIIVIVFVVPRLIGKSGAEASDLLTSTKGCVGAGGRCAPAGQECLSTEIEKNYITCPQENQKCCVKLPENKKT